MPNINRIRVNNVKYNFGTQSYDDFIMKMYGRNTLYDLANGGGKSVLMLLLMQCVIPNSTLDDKQPIEKLFRGNENTVIHSLVEWKLDDCDVTEGMRYMTTGFAAKKAGGGSDQQTIEGIDVQEAGADEDKTTAEIEYFNYCIFYRDYNKNDIVNLPLVKGEERISYKGLRNYLLDLARTDKNLIVKVFDRKGEYQRFIAEYGLYESQWELIRGINRTEGHVRTYFETNFRTTRKIIEDLLIEEIIEKAYAVKTSAEGGTGNTANLLMTIQEELKTLAEKKKRISDYDHEKELIELLSDRIEGYAGLLREKEKCAAGFADIYRTIEQEKQTADEELMRLEKERDELLKQKERLRHETEQLKLGVAREERDRAGRKAEELKRELARLEGTIEEKKREQNSRIAAGEFLDYIAARDRLTALDEEKKSAGASADKKLDIDPGRVYTIISKADVVNGASVFSSLMMPMVYTLSFSSAIIFCVVLYLMMKVMVDRSAYNISLIKVFGYKKKEIRKLYLDGNFYVIALGSLICLPLSKFIMNKLFPFMIQNVSCGLNVETPIIFYVVAYIVILILYFVINTMLVSRLNKFTPAEVLKNRE